MRKIIQTCIYLVIAGLLLAQLTGCHGTPDRGMISGGVYSNEFFGFDFTIPQGWYVFTDQQTIREVANEGINFIGGNVTQMREMVRQAQGNFLLFISEYSPEQAIGKINPNIILGFESVAGHRSQVRDGEDYLRIACDELTKMAPAFNFERNFGQVQMGSRSFSCVDGSTTIQGINVCQRMMATIKKNHVLTINLAGGSRSDIEDLTRMVQNITFR